MSFDARCLYFEHLLTASPEAGVVPLGSLRHTHTTSQVDLQRVPRKIGPIRMIQGLQQVLDERVSESLLTPMHEGSLKDKEIVRER